MCVCVCVTPQIKHAAVPNATQGEPFIWNKRADVLLKSNCTQNILKLELYLILESTSLSLACLHHLSKKIGA